jgi:hypothetical protein
VFYFVNELLPDQVPDSVHLRPQGESGPRATVVLLSGFDFFVCTDEIFVEHRKSTTDPASTKQLTDGANGVRSLNSAMKFVEQFRGLLNSPVLSDVRFRVLGANRITLAETGATAGHNNSAAGASSSSATGPDASNHSNHSMDSEASDGSELNSRSVSRSTSTAVVVVGDDDMANDYDRCVLNWYSRIRVLKIIVNDVQFDGCLRTSRNISRSIGVFCGYVQKLWNARNRIASGCYR